MAATPAGAMTVSITATLYDPTYPGTYPQDKQDAVRLALDAFVASVRAAGLYVSTAQATGAVTVSMNDLPPT